MRVRSFCLLLFFIPLLAYSKTTFVLTIPKSGTFLLKKILLMIMDESDLFYTTIARDPLNPPLIPNSPCFIFNHVYPGLSVYREVDPDKYIKVVLIRDPRDAIISFMHMLEEGWRFWDGSEGFCRLPQEEKLACAILFPDEDLGLRVFFQEAIAWMKDPSVFVLRFEDIVGPQGGGDRSTQEKTLRALVDHLGFQVSDEEIIWIADHAFGPSETHGTTFRKGQIGTWRQYFSDQNKELFKSVMGEELIQMGYETSNNW